MRSRVVNGWVNECKLILATFFLAFFTSYYFLQFFTASLASVYDEEVTQFALQLHFKQVNELDSMKMAKKA